MTTADVSVILSALAELTARVTGIVERLATIEERTSILKDHEERIRDAEDRARMAHETAIRAEEKANGQADSIKSLEDRLNSSGKFTLTTLGKTVGAIAAFVLTVLTTAAIINNWG